MRGCQGSATTLGDELVMVSKMQQLRIRFGNFHGVGIPDLDLSEDLCAEPSGRPMVQARGV